MTNPRSLIIPNEYDVKLRYIWWPQTALGVGIRLGAAAGVTYAAARIRPNCTQDVDPVLASTATAGFSEMASLFNFYRVIHYSYDMEITNYDNFPVMAIVGNSNLDPGTGSSLAGRAGNQFYSAKLLSGSAGGPCKVKFHGSYNVSTIVGSSSVETDDSYASTTSTIPGNQIWLAVGVDSLVSGSNLSNGCNVICNLDMTVRFYERKIQTI